MKHFQSSLNPIYFYLVKLCCSVNPINFYKFICSCGIRKRLPMCQCPDNKQERMNVVLVSSKLSMLKTSNVWLASRQFQVLFCLNYSICHIVISAAFLLNFLANTLSNIIRPWKKSYDNKSRFLIRKVYGCPVFFFQLTCKFHWKFCNFFDGGS